MGALSWNEDRCYTVRWVFRAGHELNSPLRKGIPLLRKQYIYKFLFSNVEISLSDTSSSDLRPIGDENLYAFIIY